MPAKSFAEVFSETINLHNYSLGQICLHLKQRGFQVNKSTLMRWRDGRTHPSFENIELIRHLPKALGLSEIEASLFIADVSQALGFSIASAKKQTDTRSAPQYRKHLGSDTLSPFTGRQVELAELQRQVTGRHSVMITGLGGVGKTRLAQELLESSLSEFVHGSEYLEISPGQTSLQVIRNVAYLLGMNLTAEALNDASRDLVLEKIRQFTSGISLIFLVDNVESVEQVRDLVRALPEIVWVFTARRGSLKSVGVYNLSLDPPSLGDAVAIFSVFAPVSDSYHSDMQEIVETLGRLPLALRLAASLLENGIAANPQELRKWLSQKGLLSSRSLSSNLRTLFGHLLENVPPEARLIFEICGAFSSPNIRMSNIHAVLKKMELQASPDSWSALGDFSLITFPDETSLELHPLLHEYARLRLKSSPDYPAIWKQFKAVYLEMAENLSSTEDESQRAYRMFLPEEANLLRVVEDAFQTADWAALKRIGPVLEGYFWQSSNYADYEKVERMCLQAAEKLGDPLWQAQTFAELGFLKVVQEDWDQADELMLAAQAIADSLPDQRFTQARIRRYRSIIAIGRGQYDQAVALHDDVEARLSQLTNPPITQLDVAKFWLHTSRMEVYYRMGDLSRARAQGIIAGQYYETINQTGSYRARDYKVFYGDVLFNLGDLNAALTTWNEMLSFADGLPLQVEEADALSRLGWAAVMQENPEQAVSLLEQARQIYIKYGQAGKIRKLENLIERVEAAQEIPGFQQLFIRW